MKTTDVYIDDPTPPTPGEQVELARSWAIKTVDDNVHIVWAPGEPGIAVMPRWLFDTIFEDRGFVVAP